ncbi:TPA: type IV secretion system protein [Legionella pneumophila]
MKRRLMISIFVLSTLAPLSHADIIGVADAQLLANAIQQLKLLQDQYETLKQTYDNAQQQLNTAQSQLDSVNQIKDFNSGHYQFGDLNNSLDDLKNRQWSPNTWDDALNNVAGGNPARYEALVKAYEKTNQTLDDEAFEKGASKAQLARYQRSVKVNKAASVESTYTYNEINKHLKAVHELSSQIERAPNTKSAIDLNSRLLAEIAYIQTQNLKMQTLISQQLAEGGANDIATESQRAQFNRLPDE